EHRAERRAVSATRDDLAVAGDGRGGARAVLLQQLDAEPPHAERGEPREVVGDARRPRREDRVPAADVDDDRVLLADAVLECDAVPLTRPPAVEIARAAR